MSTEDPISMLLPIVLPATYGLALDLDEGTLEGYLSGAFAAGQEAPATQPVGNLLKQGIVLAENGTWTHLSNRDLRDGDFEEAARTLEKLRWPSMDVGECDGVLAFTKTAFQPASLASLASFADAAREELGGEPVYFMPDWEVLFVASRDNEAALHWCTNQSISLHAAARKPLTPMPYTFVSGQQLTPFRAEGEASELAFSIEGARALASLDEYRCQAAAIARHHAKSGRTDRAPELASLETVAANGEQRSQPILATVWQEGTAPLLPAADVIALRRENGEVLWVPFDALLENAASHLRALPVHPCRWKARSWPDERALSLLRKSAVGPFRSVVHVGI